MFQTMETPIEALPLNLQAFVRNNITTNERVIFCILVQPQKRGSFDDVAPQVIVLTDFKLFATRRALTHGPGDHERSEIIIPLDNVKEVQVIYPSGTVLGTIIDWFRYDNLMQLKYAAVRVHYGHTHEQGVAYLKIEFAAQDLARRFHTELQKAAANALIRTRTPMPVAKPVISDVADQLAKLFELYKSKGITAEEYEAAKKKLLG